MNSRKKIILPIIGVLVLVIAAGSIYYFVYRKPPPVKRASSNTSKSSKSSKHFVSSPTDIPPTPKSHPSLTPEEAKNVGTQKLAPAPGTQFQVNKDLAGTSGLY